MGVKESQDNINGKEECKERATDGSQQRQYTSEKYVSGRGDRSGGGHECGTELGGKDGNARKDPVKWFDERDSEANTVGEEKENKAERDRKRRRVTTGTNKETLELNVSNVKTPFGKLIYQNGLSRVETYDYIRNSKDCDAVDRRGTTAMNSGNMECLVNARTNDKSDALSCIKGNYAVILSEKKRISTLQKKNTVGVAYRRKQSARR